MNETWDIVYTECAQKAFTWFQGVMDLFFDNCFQKCSVHIDHALSSLINVNEDFIGWCKLVPRRESTSDITI